jgi:GNAT superfamily N-acetyltransferase
MPRLGINGNPEVERWKTAGGSLASAFEMDSEEYFWARQLERPIEVAELSSGATVELAAAKDRDVWGETLNKGHDFDGGHARGHVYAAAIERSGWLHYLIRVDGEPAAASVLYIAGDTGQLFVTATRPEFRSRGFQSYFIARRLHDAHRYGCSLATTQTVTYNASPRNMQRRGFQLLYKRQILTKPL